MVRYNLLLIIRNFAKYRGPFVVNLIGLSTGLASALFIFLWTDDEMHFDKFSKNDSRLYQVLKNSPSPNGVITVEHTPGRLAEALAQEMPEVEHAVAVVDPSRSSNKGLVSYNDVRIKADALFVGEDFFNVFTLELLKGSQEKAFSTKYNVLISDQLAKKLFIDTNNSIGKMIFWNQNDLNDGFVVAGIFKQPPTNASIKADVLLSYELFIENNPKLEDWRNSDPSTYIVLKRDVDVDLFGKKIEGLIQAKNENAKDLLFLQRFSDRYLHGKYENGAVVGGRIFYVKLFAVIALFILINACINFMNLFTATAMRRIKEVGVRKIMGAKQKSIFIQFLLEAIVITMLALIVAAILVGLFLPWFNEIVGKHFSLYIFNPRIVLGAFAITLSAGIIAGSYPSLYLSYFNPSTVLMGKANSFLGGMWTRKGLVLFQSVLSVILLFSTWVLYQQMQLIQTKNLGYDKDNIAYFEWNPSNAAKSNEAFEADLELFLQNLKNIPGVLNVSNFRHSITNRQGGTTDVQWEGKAPEQSIAFTDLAVGYDFIETLGIEIKEGRSFSSHNLFDRRSVIFNEKAIDVMGIRNPIGKIVRIWGEDREIIGIAKNFHFQSFYEDIKPLFFDLSLSKRVSKIIVKIKTGTEKETLQKIHDFYSAQNQNAPFEYQFLDNDYQTLYESEKRITALANYFTLIAITISSLGLFALAAFMAERRKKEIGIRKVLGSSTWNVFHLLTLEFTYIVITALLIAFPISYLLTEKWLERFAIRIELQVWYFIGTGLLILALTFLTTGSQAIKASLANPSKTLKDE